MKVTSLCVFVEKMILWDFFILRTVMVDISLYSKIVRKVKLVYVDLLLYDLKTNPEKKTFSLITKSEYTILG